MSSDPNIQNLLAKFLHPTARAASAVPARPVASAQEDPLEKSAALRGTAREVVEAKPDDLKIPITPSTTTGGQSGGESKK